MMGFHPRTGFTADPGSQNAPKVDFGTGTTQPQVSFDTSKR
jgi:LemA protein